jgi:hypothetical protein
VWSLWRQVLKGLSAALAAHFRAVKNRSPRRNDPPCCDTKRVWVVVGESPHAKRQQNC